MGKIGIIADDLTGGTTVGVLMARSGMNTSVYFSPDEMTNSEQQDTLILTSDSRALSPSLAQEAVRNCYHALEKSGATYLSKRTDTTLRGQIGYEIDEMLAQMPEETVAVMVPAMPQSNRIVVGGYSVIDGQALSKTAVAQDVLTPVTESHVPTLISKQSKHKVGQVDLASILAGKDTLKDVLKGKKAEGCKIIICDAVTLEEITEIAETIVDLEWNVLAVDPGPFTQELALARKMGKRKPEVQFNEDKYELNIEGKVIVVAGSATDITKQQMNELNSYDEVTMISADPKQLVNNETAADEINRVHHELKERLQDDALKVAIIETAVSSPVINLQEIEKQLGIEKGSASKKINLGLAEIVEKLLIDLDDIRGIYLTGGDTMVTTLKSLGAIGIELIDYVIPQTDLGRIIGGEYDGLITIGKGGLTGSLYTPVQAVTKISEEYQNNQKQKEQVK